MVQNTVHRKSATSIVPSPVAKTSIYPQEVCITYLGIDTKEFCAAGNKTNSIQKNDDGIDNEG